MAKHKKPDTTLAIIFLVVGGIVVYVAGSIVLGFLAFMAGDSLYGVQSQGAGAVLDTILGVWLFTFPILYSCWAVLYYQGKQKPRSKK